MATPPPDALVDTIERLMLPLRELSRPVFLHDERIPKSRPLLFVGNHTLYGIIDSPHLWYHLYRQHQIFLRTLGDHGHWLIPGWRELMDAFGVVDGTPENCARLFAEGESLLVFPGGAREAFKHKGEEYQLIWGERMGFVRLALEHGATIVPFAALGADEVWEILVDTPELMQTPVGGFLKGLGIRSDLIPPIARGRGPAGAPSPQRLYFSFGAPIETAELQGRADQEAVLRGLRERCAEAIRGGLEELRAHRDADPERRLSDVLIRKGVRSVMGRLMPGARPPSEGSGNS
jgi:1-acyl-sn-glycerol-3-phosphate acyltransferase